MNITLGEMAEALYQLRKENNFYSDPSEREILARAIKNKNTKSD